MMRFLRVAALVAGTAWMPFAAAAQESGIPVGSKAPSAAVTTLDGKPADLGAWIGKTPLLIEFWAHWCSSCKELEPKLLELERKYGGRMKFLGVAVSVSQSPARVKAYTERYRYRHETLFDADGRAADVYDVPATSYVVIVDSKGEVTYTGVGGRQNLEPAILSALAGK